MVEDRQWLEARLEAAVRFSREAAELLLGRIGGGNRIDFKGEIDIVTEADRASEDLLIGRLRSAFPEDSIITEESGGYRGGSPYAWVMDPLDGTTNYSHGFPFFCVSVALVKDRQPLVGAVCDPVRFETFTATAGGGAFLNGKRLAVSAVDDLNVSLLATGFPYDIRHSKDDNMNYFAAFAVRAQAIRRAGSAALDLCYVGAGRFDGYWELKLKPWDMAAGVLIVREAGGVVTDMKGGPWNLEVRQVAASNRLIHPAMLRVISQARRPEEASEAGP